MSTNVSEVADRTLYGFWLSPYMSLVAHVLTEAGLEYRYQRPLFQLVCDQRILAKGLGC